MGSEHEDKGCLCFIKVKVMSYVQEPCREIQQGIEMHEPQRVRRGIYGIVIQVSFDALRQLIEEAAVIRHVYLAGVLSGRHLVKF
ncbi:MAG: hypothetical protein IKX53_08380 [Bacteroidales bacterium]|nr:hypothetical protein [Bacteroidales bacterium]